MRLSNVFHLKVIGRPVCKTASIEIYDGYHVLDFKNFMIHWLGTNILKGYWGSKQGYAN